MRREFKYLIIGAINTVAGFAIFTALFEALKEQFHYQVILILAQVIAVIFSHAMQRRFVWHSIRPYFSELWKFGSIYILTMFINILLLHVAHEIFSFPILWSQYAIGSVIVAASYVIQRRFVFEAK